MKTTVPVAPGLFTLDDPPRLLASQCAACGVTTFPRQPDCPSCTGEEMNDIELPERGTLWTFTTQQFIPKSPPYAIAETAETFEPYGVGYVEFDGLLKVEGRLTESSVDNLHIGMDMEVVVIPLLTDADGNDVVTYAFRPVV
jgi:uncharacterized OB-fold protein